MALTGGSVGVDLQSRTKRTDFAKLRTFKLYRDIPIETLSWLTDTLPFSAALKEFGVDFSPESIADSSDAIENLLDSLPPLRTLRLECAGQQSVRETAFRPHGSSLHSLLLGKTLEDARSLSEIRTGCPNLRKLAVSITRSAGDGQETACYRAIGAFEHLSHLILTLRVRKPLSASDEESMMRTVLIDTTVNESLAADIFRLVSMSHGSLETLDLSVDINAREFGYKSFASACERLARSWHCEKNPRNDAPGHACVTKETGVEDKEDRESAASRWISPSDAHTFHALWPGTSDWRLET